MFLKEIVINGFKSFADRTRIDLTPGITAIVGPNGCGKSNIVDAIRWVLGEQSAKALRGGSMHDVIFSGTDKRKPLPFCEVELVFADCEKDLGTAFNEVSIVRRVSREDSSDYFLNGKSCRLKDIQRLFMDTGVGRVSYSFMVQGQIDQILSANPAERRTLFEEAAGITRYKAQRKEALGKLALVDQNLARITDVVDEISRQIGSLKRQAAKALRWKRTQHRLRHLDLAALSHQYSELRAAIIALESEAGTLRGNVAARREALREREEALAAAKVERAELFRQIEQGTQMAFALRSEKENAEAQAQMADARQGDLRERVAQVEQESVALAARRAELEARLQGDASNKLRHADDVEGADENYRRSRSELEALLENLSAADRALAQERQSLLMNEGEITRHRATVTNVEVELRTSESRHAEIANTLAQMREERHALEARDAEIRVVAETRRAEHARARQDVAEAQERSKALAAQFREQQQKISQLDRVVARTSAQVNVLEQQLAKFEGFSAGAKAVLRGELGDRVPAETAHALNALIEIGDPDDAGAVEALLGAAAEALVFDPAISVPAVARALAEKDAGAAFLADGKIVARRGETASAPTNVPAEAADFLRPAGTLFSVKNSAVEPTVRALFERCFVCDRLSDFLEFLEKNPSFDFLLVATPNGETVDCRGFIRSGANADGNGGVFRRQNELRQLRERLTAENDALTEANHRAMEIQAESEENEAETERRRVAAAELAQELSDISADERASEKALNDNAAAVSRQENLLADFEANRDRAKARMDEAQERLSAKESEIEAAKAHIAECEKNLETLRRDAETRRDALNEVRFDLAQKKQKLELFERELADARAQIEEIASRIATREREKEMMLAQIAAFGEQSATARARAEQLAGTIEEAAKTLDARRVALAEHEAKSEELERSLAAERETLREDETKLNALDVRLTEETSQCTFVSEKVSAEYQLDVGSVDWKQNLWLADEEFETKVRFDELEDEDGADHEIRPKVRRERGEPTPEDLAAMDDTDWAPIRREIVSLRERLNAMGAVNHAAIEEYAELRERYAFLKAQSDDLWNSKNELIKAIDEINGTSQKLFTETFEQIRKNFKFTFERLFHGGESDLQLVQSEDVLDSGIEIIARPPGTKLRGISLLSGGQRTMTAVALLFGIYMVKPSPFCVLDELDAPLDDANVGRFTDIVREFTRYSQFLVVTHNKRTVSAANTIYGVTMQERGVTQLLSMRYNADSGDTETIALEGASGRNRFDMAR